METKATEANAEGGAASRGLVEAASDAGRTSAGIIVIVARNNLQLTKQAFKSAIAQDIPIDIIVINNASTDGTGAWLRSKAGRRGKTNQYVYSIEYQWQRSLAFCWNVALWQMMAVKSIEHMLVCNNDIELRPDAYRLLLHHGGDFVTCVSVDTPERLCLAKIKSDEKTTSDWNNYANEVRLRHPRPHPDFSCFLIRREVVKRVGYFDESYFPAYAEDAEYHVRMHRAGIQAVCVDVPFLHHGAATLKYASPADQAIIRRGADDNRERFRQTYGCLPGSKEYEELFR